MKTVDLRHERFTIDELLQLAVVETVIVRSKQGGDFIIEAADSFDREVEDLGGSERFAAFLRERFEEAGRIPLDEIERRLGSSSTESADVP
jgi:hypothetical protein